MKKIFKKLLMILLCFCLIFSLHVFKPKEDVKAFVLTPALIYAGYALGAVALGGLATVALNEDVRNGVMESAGEVINNATDDIKQSINDAWVTSKTLGKTYVALGSKFWDWAGDTATKSIANDILKLTPVAEGISTLFAGETWHIGTNRLDQKWNLPVPIINSQGRQYWSVRIGLGDVLNGYTGRNLTGQSARIGKAADLTTGILTRREINFDLTGTSFKVGNDSFTTPIDNWADQVGRSLDKVFNRQASADQVYIPADGLPAVGVNGEKLSWNNRLERWEIPSADVIYTGDVALDTKSMGLVTDGAGNIVMDKDIPRVGTIEKDLTVKDVLTGDKVGTIEKDIPIDGSIPVDNTDAPPIDVPVPPPSLPGQINWDKLKFSGEIFTTAFPFSLPWDVSRALDATFGGISSTNVPDFEFEIRNFTGEKVKKIIVIPDQVTNMLPFVRSFIIIIFDVSIIYAIRRLFGGAS